MNRFFVQVAFDYNNGRISGLLSSGKITNPAIQFSKCVSIKD
jgi:hypothetical protein